MFYPGQSAIRRRQWVPADAVVGAARSTLQSTVVALLASPIERPQETHAAERGTIQASPGQDGGLERTAWLSREPHNSGDPKGLSPPLLCSPFSILICCLSKGCQRESRRTLACREALDARVSLYASPLPPDCDAQHDASSQREALSLQRRIVPNGEGASITSDPYDAGGQYDDRELL
jgi:hypothetical protein